MNLLEAVQEGRLDVVTELLSAGADVNVTNDKQYSALVLAVLGGHREVIDALIAHGIDLETKTECGRTALFVAAESHESPELVRCLMEAGANADLVEEQGIHVLEHAWSQATKDLISAHIGKPAPEPEPRPTRLSAKSWRVARAKFESAFTALESAGLVCLMGSGSNQDDALADCSVQFLARGGKDAGLSGFCFSSGADVRRARNGDGLSLGFGSADGDDAGTIRVGELVCKTFRDHGFDVEWGGTGATRPLVKV